MNAAMVNNWTATSWLPKASRVRGLTKLFVSVIGMWGVGLCIAGFKTAALLPDYGWTSSGVGLVGVLMVVASSVGVLAFWHSRTTRMLLFFCSLSLIAVFALLVLAGASFFNRHQVGLFIDDSWNLPVEIGWPANFDGVLRNLYAGEGDSIAHSDKRLTSSTLQSYMVLIACIGWCSACLLLSASRHVADVVGTKRAIENMLETVNMMMLPIGLLSVMAGQFIADSATLSSSSITSFVLAISGIMLMALSFLGCFGTAVDSRGVLKVYALINFVLGVALVSCGIGTMVVAERVQLELTSKWEQIRVVLPPTFKGKYDRSQFSAFVEANLFLLGYTAVVFGGVLGFQWYAAQLLRASLKQETIKREKDTSAAAGAGAARGGKRPSLLRQTSGRVAQFTATFAQGNPANLLREQWRERYKKGSAQQRKFFKIGGAVCCLVLLCVIAVVVAALVFSTFCDSLDRSSTFTYYTLASATTAELVLANQYRTGQTTVLPPDEANPFSPYAVYASGVASSGGSGKLQTSLLTSQSGGIAVEQFALTTAQAEGDIQCSGFGPTDGAPACSASASALQLNLSPSAPDRIMGLDTSCQLSSMHVMWPIAANGTALKGLAFQTIADVVLGDLQRNASVAGRQLKLAGINGSTDFGHVEARNLQIGADGTFVSSRGGDLLFSEVQVRGNTAHSGGENTVFSVTADLGTVGLKNFDVRDASLEARAINAAISGEMIVAAASLGAAPLSFHNTKGSVVLRNVEGTWIDISTTEGLVQLNDVTQLSSSTRTARLKIATTTGAVLVRQLRVDGSVSIETQTGDVTVQLLAPTGRAASFTGLFSLRTRGTGSINVRLGSANSLAGGIVDFFEHSQQTAHLHEGGINCGRQGSNDCPYTGGLQITTHVKGNIQVVLGCDDPQGCPNCATPLCDSNNM